MIPDHDPPLAEEAQLEALLAFDRELAAGKQPALDVDRASPLYALHECQLLLESVWPRTVPHSPDLPRRFGRFSIDRELGRGGFGVVWLAWDTVLRRQVALKVPRPEVLLTPEVKRRFLREAVAASRLDHPHIVPVFEVGEEGPICYIASAYCEGPTLAEWLRSRSEPVPALLAARLVALLSAAVAHAHERSILHRDLKPGNVLLARLGASQSAREGVCRDLGFIPRVGDFGLAKLLDQATQETRSGVPIGSSSYMAPEQATGRLREQGPATDVYALGVILYELLTGSPPLRGETDLETLHLITDQEPASPRALRPGLPRDLETIVLKCLEKRPTARYATASELTEDLERFAGGKAVRARPVAAWERAGKWARRQPVHAILAVVCALALASFLGVLTWSDNRLRRHHRDVREAVSRTERDVRRDERSAHESHIEMVRSEEREQFAQRYGLATQIKLIHETFEQGNVALATQMRDALGSAPGRPAPGGFAWGYLNQLFRPEVTLLGDYQTPIAPVLLLAVSPDGRTLAAGMAGGRVALWDLVEERLLRSLRHHEPATNCEVYFLAFSRDSRLLASGSPNHVLKIWDVATGTERAVIHPGQDRVAASLDCPFTLRFTDSADFLLGFWRGRKPRSFHVLVWNVPAPGARPELKATLDQQQLPKLGRQGPVQEPSWQRADEAAAPWLAYAREHLIVLDDGATLAIRDDSTGATLYEPNLYVPAAEIRGPLNIPALCTRPRVAPTPDDGYMSASARRVVGATNNKDRRHLGPYRAPEFSPDGLNFAYAEDPGVSLIDLVTGRTVSSYIPQSIWTVVDVAFTRDGRALIVAGLHPQIHLWRLRTDRLAGHAKETWSLSFSPDGRTLASASDDHSIKIWDVESGQERATLKGHGSLVTAVSYSPDGALVASAGFDKTVRLWKPASRALLATLRGHTDRVRTVTFSHDGKTLASAGDDHEIRLWDVAAGRVVASPLAGHTDRIFALAFSPDGKTLFSGATDGTIRAWDWSRGECRAVRRQEDQVYALAVSPDGQTLAVGQKGGGLTLWDAALQKARPSLRRHADDVLGLAFSPDGLALASVGRDKTVRIWDPLTAQELLTLKGHQGPVHAVAFAPESAMLATGSHDGAIRLWRAAPGALKR